MNDNQITIAGNLVADPAFRELNGGGSRTTFRVASTPRRFSSATGQWENQESIFVSVVCWHRLAERVSDCLRKGDPVTVTGRLRMRTFEVDEQRRTTYEIEAQQVSPDLNRVGVQLVRQQRVQREVVDDWTSTSSASPFGERPAAMAGEPAEQPAVAATLAEVNTGPLVPVAAEPSAA